MTAKHLEKNKINKTMGTKEWGLIVLLSVIWGGSFFFVEVALESLTPFTIVLFRVGLAATFLLIFLTIKGISLPRDIKIWIGFLVMGALNNIIPFSLIVWGQTHIQSSLAAILNATTPIFTVMLAHLFSKDEKLTFNKGFGVMVGWAGVAILIGTDALDELNIGFFGQLAIIGAAISYACAGIYGHRFRKLNTAVVSTGMLIGSTIMMIPFVFIFESPLDLSINLTTWGAILGLSLICTALAYIIYFRVLATAGATNLLLVTFLIPISAIFLGVSFLNEQLQLSDIGGMGVIFLGLLLIDGRLFKRQK